MGENPKSSLTVCALSMGNNFVNPFPVSMIPVTMRDGFNFRSTDEITIFVTVRLKYFGCCFYFQ